MVTECTRLVGHFFPFPCGRASNHAASPLSGVGLHY